MKDYASILRAHHLKVTPQRLAISEALYSAGHMSIEELYTVMIRNFSSISLATIYKNVNIMIKNSFIQEVKLPQSKSVYELAKDTHAHLLCKECKMIEDLDVNLQETVDESMKKSGFEIKETNLVLTGFCKNCQ